MDPQNLIFLLLPLLLVASALCSGSETALFSLTHRERREMLEGRQAGARAVERLLSQPRRLLVTVLLLNMTTNVLYFVSSSVLSLGAESGLEAFIYGVGSLAAIILFGEILAKLLAGATRVRFSRFIAPPLLAAQGAISPLLGFLDRFAVAPLTRLLSTRTAAVPLDAEELGALIRIGLDQGAFGTREQRLLAGVVEMNRIRVREVMIPRVEVRWIDADLPNEAFRQAVLELVAETRHTKFPVTRGDLGGVIGVLNAKAYLSASPPGGPAPDPTDFAEKPTFVPENIRLDQALARFTEEAVHMALVVDERGEVCGLVEIEDLVERLLDESRDPAEADQLGAELIGIGRWIVPGRLPVRDWSVLFGLDQAAESDMSDATNAAARASTVGGLVIASLGRVPEPGDRVRFGPVDLIVTETEGRVVRRVEVRLIEAPEPPPGSAEGVQS